MSRGQGPASDRACDEASREYEASPSPHNYQIAVTACNQQNLAADRYNEVFEAYKVAALKVSSLFRSHPMNADRIQALTGVVEAMRTDSVASTAEWAYAFRVASSVLRRTNEGPTRLGATAAGHQRTGLQDAEITQPIEARGYIWIGKFTATFETADRQRHTVETTDTLGIYSEDDFRVWRAKEVEARSELIRKFLDSKGVRLLNVELKAIERQVFDDQAKREEWTEGR